MPRPIQLCTAILQISLLVFFIIFIEYQSQLYSSNPLDVWNTPSWKPVDDSKYRFFVYSAFKESRDLIISSLKSPVIRVIGVAKLNPGRELLLEAPYIEEKAYCRLWGGQDETGATRSVITSAVVFPMQEHWKMEFSACFIYCPIPTYFEDPQSVSIYSASAVEAYLKSNNTNDLPTASNRLQIHDPSENEEIDKPLTSLAVCVKPMHNIYNNVWDLVEWLEVNQVLGFSHFYFYDHEVSSNVSCVLNEYVSRGLATVLDWKNLPLISQKEIRTENMFAALNDCLYRGMYKHKYLAIFDLDELLVPKRGATLTDLLDRSNFQNDTAASFVFRNAFFYLRWHNDPLYKGFDLKVFKKTRRRVEILSNEMRTKYIFKPELVLEVGNHAVWDLLDSDLDNVDVPLKECFMHHYRNCEFGGDRCLYSKSVRDRSMWRHRNQILARIVSVQNDLIEKCRLEPIKYMDGSVMDESNDTFPFPDQDAMY